MLVRLIAILSFALVFPALAMQNNALQASCADGDSDQLCADLYRQLDLQARRDGAPEALILLAYLHLNGDMGVSKDIDKAIDYYKRAARKKAPVAQYELAKLLLEGKHIEQDRDLAMYLLDSAANRGYDEARMLHNMLLIDDPDTKQTERLALAQQIEELDLRSPAFSRYYLGKFYLTQNDPLESLKHLQKASQLGHTQARELLSEKFPNAQQVFPNAEQDGFERFEVVGFDIGVNEATREVIDYTKQFSGYGSKFKSTGTNLRGKSCEFDRSCAVMNCYHDPDTAWGDKVELPYCRYLGLGVQR